MKAVTRVQTGVRIEGSLLKVAKGLAEALDMSLGELFEAVLLHSFEGKLPFAPATLAKIEALREVYGLTLRAEDAHHLSEVSDDK